MMDSDNFMSICSYSRAEASPIASLPGSHLPVGLAAWWGKTNEWIMICCRYPLQYLYGLCLMQRKVLWNVKFPSRGRTALQDWSCGCCLLRGMRWSQLILAEFLRHTWDFFFLTRSRREASTWHMKVSFAANTLHPKKYWNQYFKT